MAELTMATGRRGRQRGWRERLASLQGVPIDDDLRAFERELREINRLEREVVGWSDHDIGMRADACRARASGGAPPDELRPLVFALVREAARRTLQLRPFDVQVLGALALDLGRMVEMQTGEGKTLAAVMPAALNALTGPSVHVLTFNDYLARRDAEWMGPVYRLLGLSVAFVEQGMTPAARRSAYRADVTYVTAKEAGFDDLRDQLAMDAADLVHRGFHFAIVDEADSLLIDEARIPLVLAGSVDRVSSSARALADFVAGLTPRVDFEMDEYGRIVELTEAGVDAAERALGCGGLHEAKNYWLLTELNCALHARALLRRDVDYLVRDGRIELVDEFTGRVVHDRHWPDGLQAALEAKEHVERRPDGRILGSITLQHFLGRYARLSGMTGTARSAASEVHAMYGLRTVVIPTNRPAIRVDRPDVIFTHREAKLNALVGEIQRVHGSGRPILVGTLSVKESEIVAERLREAGVACEVLNAKNDAVEAAIVARAGCLGAVTIATNMAGRGTDIPLGGHDNAARDQVSRLGGLYVIGTNRHESSRVDLQLRGRAGRQGDPGETQFFISLEDDLLVRYGIQQLLPAQMTATKSHTPVESPVVRREVARAQRIVEGQNLEIRKTLWRYASVVEDQRRRLMDRRAALVDGRQTPDIWRASAKRAAFVGAAGDAAVDRAERIVTLRQIDRGWCDHLAVVNDLREGVHLVALGGTRPPHAFHH